MKNANHMPYDKARAAKRGGMLTTFGTALLRNTFGVGKKRRKEWPHYLPPLG